ncbi:Hypothetical predicted protein, partial [Prunus dulcis]
MALDYSGCDKVVCAHRTWFGWATRGVGFSSVCAHWDTGYHTWRWIFWHVVKDPNTWVTVTLLGMASNSP